MRVLRQLGPPLGLILAFFAGWETLVRLWEIPTYLLPAPTQIFQAIPAHLEILWLNSGVTLAAVGLGFGISLLGGLALGIAIFYSPMLERALYPILIASRNVPLFTIAPLLIVWMGFGLPPKVVVAVIIAFFPLVVSTYDGLRALDADLVNLFRALGATRWQILRKLRLPAALPFIFSGAKLSLVYSIIGAVFAEMVVGGQVWRASGVVAGGLGYWIRHATNFGHLDLAFALILWLSGLSLVLFGCIVWIERHLLRWQRVERI
ncbi:MAG: ABC transporter permease [Candidatus Bipolaricaulota bacterium]|nr:ABC transporter permease [Candidatus Bipolaricaulota bacterium]MDW8031296.1 ABC transporter permease [Candidatus Bipolaricaulota bacterium]